MPIRILHHQIHAAVLALAAIEFAIFAASLYLGVYTRFAGDVLAIREAFGPLWLDMLLFAAVMSASLISMGLYLVHQRTSRTAMLLRVSAAFGLGLILAMLTFYLFPMLFIGRGALALSALYALVLVVVVRLFFYRLVDESVFKRRVLVYGAGRRAHSIAQLRRRTDRRGFDVEGFVLADGDAVSVEEDHLVEIDRPLLAYCRDRGVDEIVIGVDDRRRSFPVGELLECRLAGIDVVDLPSFLERETGKVRLDVLNPAWLIFGEGFKQGTWRTLTKRLFDIVASVLLLALIWPLVLLTALAIKVEDGWRAPVFYRQTRVGLEERPFNLLKFRSMVVDAESEGARWAEENDRRITQVGSVIRKFRIDELPQLINVLLGSMSFVGPRPERPEFVAQLNEEIPYYRERHCAKPGITGWAQLSYQYGSSEQDAIEKLQYDLYYVKNQSLLFDLVILMQTVEVILWGKGAR